MRHPTANGVENLMAMNASEVSRARASTKAFMFDSHIRRWKKGIALIACPVRSYRTSTRFLGGLAVSRGIRPLQDGHFHMDERAGASAGFW